MRIYVIMPAYNEQGRILATLKEYWHALGSAYGKDVRLIVVSDSTDNTNKIVAGYARKQHGGIKLFRGSEKKGKGAALARGFAYACADSKMTVVGFVDADPVIPGKEITKLIGYLGERGTDGVIASRYARGSVWIGRQRPVRYIASRAYNQLVRLLFGLPYRDTQCGAKFFKKRALCGILNTLALTDMSFDLDLLYEMHLHGFRVVEKPVAYRWIREGSTLVLKKQIPQMMIVALGYRITRSPINVLVPPALKGAVYNFFKRW